MYLLLAREESKYLPDLSSKGTWSGVVTTGNIAPFVLEIQGVSVNPPHFILDQTSETLSLFCKDQKRERKREREREKRRK